MRSTIGIALCLAVLVPGFHSALADDSGQMVVTATRTAQPISTIGSSVSVLTESDLQNLGVDFIDDALRTLPGVSVTQTGGPGGQSAVRIRGEEGYRTVVLLDGIRIDDPSGTQVATNFANLMVSDVQQIEVVRGPQSLLYGADAIGGVVQILTAHPSEGLHYEGEASSGSYDTYAASGTIQFGRPELGFVVSATDEQTQGFTEKVGDPALADADGDRVLALHGVVRAEPSDAFDIEGVVHYTDSVAQFDGASAFPPFSPADPFRDLVTKETDGRIAITHHGWDGIKTELAYAYYSTNHDDLSDGAPYVYGSTFDGSRGEASLLSTITVSSAQTVLIGLDRADSTARTDTIKENAHDTGLYSEWQGAFGGQLYLTGGLRYDVDSDFGSHISGRATAAWLRHFVPDETTKFHASFGTGFRAPSPYERATNMAAALPDLKDEQSRGFDLGVTQELLPRAASVDLTLFQQEIDNEIRYDNVGFTGYFQEPGRSRSRGVELSGRYQHALRFGALSGLALETSFTYTDSTVHSPDAENGLPRIRRPRYASATTATFDFGDDKATLSFTLLTAAKTEDGFSSFRVPLDSYGIINVSARYRLTPQAEVFVRGVNLTDEQYEEVSGFATSDAAVYFGIRLRG